MAKLLLALILVVGVVAIAIGIDRFRDEPPTVPGERIAPERAAQPGGPT